MNRHFCRTYTKLLPRAVGKVFREFCEHTPIHGVPYTGQRGRKPVERALWVGILLIATSFCSYLIYKSHKKWMETPVLVDFKTEVVNIWEIPFPAVTICPGHLVFDPDSQKDDCVKEGSRLLMKLICAFGGNGHIQLPEMKPNCSLDDVLEEAVQSLISINDPTFLFLMNKVSYDILLTEFGLCYTFNLLGPDDIFKEEVVLESLILRKSNISRTTNWRLSKGYENLNATYPFRAFAADVRDSLVAVIFHDRAAFLESCTSSNIGGYSIMLHSPIEYPSSDKEVITGPTDSSIVVYVKPKAIYASEDIESIPITKRRCFFEHESSLRFFKYYTETNCQLECLSNYTYELCNCVPVHLPRSGDMRLCQTSQEVKCSQNAPGSLIEVQFNNRYTKSETCNCLPNCNELTYESETVHSSYEGTAWIGSGSSATVFVYYWESEFWPATRSRLYSLFDFLADCGSLMGLCMGVSFVSLIEILYHCTLRHLVIRRKSYEVKNHDEHTEEVDITAL